MLRETLAVIIIAGAALAANPWTWQDTAWEAGYQLALLADHQQSEGICGGPYYEQNPLLPKHMSQRTLNAACVLSSLGHFAVSYALPTSKRRTWQVATFAVEASVVDHNRRIGMSFVLKL
jgi:hypothetical protein